MSATRVTLLPASVGSGSVYWATSDTVGFLSHIKVLCVQYYRSHRRVKNKRKLPDLPKPVACRPGSATWSLNTIRKHRSQKRAKTLKRETNRSSSSSSEPCIVEVAVASEGRSGGGEGVFTNEMPRQSESSDGC